MFTGPRFSLASKPIGRECLQHLPFFSSGAAKRVISWSSLDWRGSRWNQLDLVLGTVFDIFAHTVTPYFLAAHVESNGQLLAAAAFVLIVTFIVLFNPKLAWASTYNVPEWVQKRMRPLTEDQRQDVQLWEDMTKKFM